MICSSRIMNVKLHSRNRITGKPLAKYWMHNGYININNEKMSKSLGNGITVNELVKRIKPAVIRYFMLSAHYRSPLNFSDETITQAENSVERIVNCAANLHHRLAVAISADDEETSALRVRVEAIKEQFQAKMDDDFNTPDAITALFDLVSEANQHLQRPVVSAESLQLLIDIFESFDQVLGFCLPYSRGRPAGCGC